MTLNITRKYLLRGYILGVLTHTTAWDRHWLGFWNSDHVVLKLSIRSSASPRLVVVWLDFWNPDHVVLKSSKRSSASPRSVAVWLGFLISDYVVLKSSIRSSALPCLVAVWLAFWNSDHVVVKSSIRTLASPWQQWSDWGLRVTQDAYFSLLSHTKQLLLVTFSDTTAGIGASFRTDGRQTAAAEGQTDA